MHKKGVIIEGTLELYMGVKGARNVSNYTPIE